MIKSQEVYGVFCGKDCYYIGSGLVGRHKHCLSGTSHVYELNKIHFLKEVELECRVMYYFDTKEEARQREVELIKELNPILNKAHTNDKTRTKAMIESKGLRKYIEACLAPDAIFLGVKRSTLVHVRAKVADILENFTVQDLTVGVLMDKTLLRRYYSPSHVKRNKPIYVVLHYLFKKDGNRLLFTEDVINNTLVPKTFYYQGDELLKLRLS